MPEAYQVKSIIEKMKLDTFGHFLQLLVQWAHPKIARQIKAKSSGSRIQTQAAIRNTRPAARTSSKACTGRFSCAAMNRTIRVNKSELLPM